MLLANHTVGVRALMALRACADVCAVVAHPPDVEDGVRYLSVYEHARQAGLRVERLHGRDPRLIELLERCQPDLLLCVDYRYLLPAEAFRRDGLVAINLHPGLLPQYRGRAPLNWAILNGETELGLTAHVIDEGVDSGDIVLQERFALAESEDVGDALKKLYPRYARMVSRLVALACVGSMPRTPQNHARATVYPRRRPEDGEIDWSQPARAVHRLVRAVAAPYPGAFTHINGQRLTVWKASPCPGDGGLAGSVVSAEETGFVVNCGDGALKVSRWSVEGVVGDACAPRTGEVFADRMAEVTS